MSAAHTPGPWELRHEFGMQGLIYPVGGDYPVASVTGYFHNAKQTEPNARLIAAAPMLLDALEAAADLMEQEDFATLTLLPKLRAAIAAARGQA